MSAHPSAFQLEAHSAGEHSAVVHDHLQTCAECSGYLVTLEAERRALMELEPAASLLRVPKIEATLPEPAASKGWPRWVAFLPLGLAALTLLGVGVLTKPAPQGQEDLLFKGASLKVKVVRARGASQSEHDGAVKLAVGDRIRLLVVTDRPGPLLLGHLDAEGTWTELSRHEHLPAGQHSVPKSALEITEGTRKGRFIVGPPAKVLAARRGAAEHGAHTIETESEANE